MSIKPSELLKVQKASQILASPNGILFFLSALLCLHVLIHRDQLSSSYSNVFIPPSIAE